MAKKLKISEKRKLQKSGFWFTQKEVAHLVRGAKTIGFKPLPNFIYNKKLIFDKKLDKSQIRNEISFVHICSKEHLRIEKYELKNSGLDIFKDNITDVFVTMLFKQHASELEGIKLDFE